MKKVAKSPKIIDVLNIQGVQRQLERLADLLGKIQKALGEYLEQERASFPRLESRMMIKNVFENVTLFLASGCCKSICLIPTFFGFESFPSLFLS